jgi:uncharacterized protein (TIGR00299 family) protein
MPRVLYFDCFSGISGDMVLGALLDAGLPFEELKRALGSLALSGVDIGAERVLRAGVSATKFTAREQAGGYQRTALGSQPATPAPEPSHAEHHAGHGHNHQHSHGDTHAHDHANAGDHAHSPDHSHRSLPEIFDLIDGSALSTAGRDRAKALFRKLAETEASIHQMPVERVHLHEVGALDSIVDIVGAVFGLEWAGVDEIICSPLNVGGGMVDSAHGHFPVPAPATLKLLAARQAPIYSGATQNELVTPTGALIAASYAASFGAIPPMTVERIGYGAGDRDPAGTPNVLRVIIGHTADRTRADRTVVIECEIDDMNPQIFGVVMDRLYAAGALEVFYIAVQMKKNRPGTLLTVIAPPDLRQPLIDIVFRETTTIGVRYTEVDREVLQREFVTVDTPLGSVRFKLAWHDGAVVNAAPEFDDCARIAQAKDLPVKEVQAIAVQAYGARGATLPLENLSDRPRTEGRHS